MPQKMKATPNSYLRRERERRCWSQQELADMLGTTPLNIGRWERGVTQPGPHFRQKLCELFERTPQQLGLVSGHTEPSLTIAGDLPSPENSSSYEAIPASPIWSVPYRRNPFFTGRDEILAQLRETFTSSRFPSVLAQPQAISGLGGIGKTQTAIEYAYRYRDSYTTILWSRAESADLLTSDFLTIGMLLRLPECDEQEQDKVIKAVIRWFDTHEGWLLILDNADDIDLVNDYLPSAGKGHVLLTTRAFSTGTTAERIELETMEQAEGTLFLLRRIKRLKGMSTLDVVSSTIREQAEAIVDALDGLPLALDQAGAYIEETGCSLSDYLKFYRTRRNRLLRTRGRDASGHPEPVAATWSLSFEKVEQANPAAAELLKICAFLSPDAIPEAMLTAGASELGTLLQTTLEDDLELNDAIRELHRYSLIKRHSEQKYINIHRMVQAVVRDRMKEEEERMWAERAVMMVNTAFPEEELIEKQRYLSYIAHAQTCEEIVKQLHVSSSHVAQLLNQLGHNLAHHAQYTRAEPLMVRSLAMREQILGSDHPDVAETLNNLGALYITQDKFEQAELFLRRALAIRERAANPYQAGIVKSLCSLSHLHRHQGHYESAERLLQRALSLTEQEVGESHPDTAQVLHLLAMIYWFQGFFEKAEAPLLRALHIQERLLDPEHKDIASTLNDLGVLYENLGKYEQAEVFYLRSLALREQAHDGDHPDLATAMSNLALFYSQRGKYAQSESLHWRAIEMRRHLFGQEHPEIARSMNHLGVLYYGQGKYAETEKLWLQALTMREHYFGLDHPDVAESFHNLASLYRLMGKYTQSEAFFRQALSLREKLLGPMHPYIGQSLTNFAVLYRVQGKYEQAKELLLRALPIREQALGPMHPDVAFTLQNLGSVYHLQGKYGDAEKMFLRALDIRKQSLPPEHPDIAATLVGLAYVYQMQENVEKAEELFQRALHIQEQALGADYPGIAETVCGLASLYQYQHNYTQAEQLFQRALAIRENKLGKNHPDVANVLVSYAELLRKIDREVEACDLESRAAAIKAKQL